MWLPALLLFASAAWASPASSLVVDDPGILAKLEGQGFDLGRLAFRSEKATSSTRALRAVKDWSLVAKTLEDDLKKLRAGDWRLRPSMHAVHRLFNPKWLDSQDAFFELAGAVNRLDRAPFEPSNCGELRFIYRLAYRKPGTKPIYSRLPATLNVVFWAKREDGGCSAYPARWRAFVKGAQTGSASFSSLGSLALKSLELNVQSVRWPSTIRPDMGGYAEYILRVFKATPDGLAVGELENTPDVEKLKRDPALKARLRAWLRSNLKSLDEGVTVLPSEFLATEARSVALDGAHRLANAPFTRLFADADFADFNFDSYKVVRSPAGVLRRLNDLSCVGCHQGRTVAGFHFLGRDRTETEDVNSILVSASPHFLLDQPRRARYVAGLEEKKALSAFRPLSIRAEQGEGQMGSHCGLDLDPSFEHWGCAKGFECKRLIRDKRVSPTGICVPSSPIAGSPCQSGAMSHDEDPRKDKVTLDRSGSCGGSHFCEDTSVGFPGGMCAGPCFNMRPGETCGSIAILASFNECLARGKLPFAKCLGENVRPAAMQECNEATPCRDDYICARVAPARGTCIPPYFLFQLRVDGHPEL